jgi:hypothetical protein
MRDCNCVENYSLLKAGLKMSLESYRNDGNFNHYRALHATFPIWRILPIFVTAFSITFIEKTIEIDNTQRLVGPWHPLKGKLATSKTWKKMNKDPRSYTNHKSPETASLSITVEIIIRAVLVGCTYMSCLCRPIRFLNQFCYKIQRGMCQIVLV